MASDQGPVDLTVYVDQRTAEVLASADVITIAGVRFVRAG